VTDTERRQATRQWSARLGRWLVWSLAAGFVIYLGGYLSMAAYIRFGGSAVREFCSREWQGKDAQEVVAQAGQAGLVTSLQGNLVRVRASDRQRSRHTCDVTIAAGRVAKTRASFLF